MVLEFLMDTYAGNTLLSWVYFFATIIIFVLIAKTIIFFTRGFGRRITNKIKGNLDDIFLDMIEEPLAFVMIVIGLYLGYYFLNFDATVDFYFFNVIKLLGIAAGTWIVIRIIDALLETFIKPLIGKTKTKYDDQLVQLLGKLLKLFTIVLAAIIVLDSFGVDVFTLLAGLGIGGLAIAFAAKETISDAFGGFSILISKPFILGDTIEFDSNIGIVEEISLRHTRIRNLEKRLLTIPNSKIASSVVINISSAPKRKTIWNIGVTYSTSLAKVEKAKTIIEKAIKECKLCEKEPIVAFDEFASSSLNILVIFYTNNGDFIDMVKAKDEVGLKIKKEFEKNKIEFAFPTQTIHLEK